MEDRQYAGLIVGVNCQSQEQSAQILQLLHFAEVPATHDLAEATVVIGDQRAATEPRPFIRLLAEGAEADNGLALHAPLRLSTLLDVLARARSQLEACEESQAPQLTQYVGISEAAIDVRRMIARAAARDVTVLVTGESGTGKEVVARTLHACSSRCEQPFVPINCGAIPAELLESELFGHEKGAFTGAITQKVGRFELAHGGTLFLDEIGDMPFAMQVKLLRAIEQKSFERVGSAQTRVSDVRIIAATNANLENKIASGEFREDLYYRLAVLPIELAPLRTRVEDLPLLVNTLVARIQAEQGLFVKLSVDALGQLSEYQWPGNVRELFNLLQRLTIEYPNSLVRCQDLPRKYVEPALAEPMAESVVVSSSNEPSDILLPLNGIDLKDYLTRLEKSLIEQALDDTNSVVARAADRLHIRRTTLVEKMRKHGIGREAEVQA